MEDQNKELQKRLRELEEENQFLKNKLESHGISIKKKKRGAFWLTKKVGGLVAGYRLRRSTRKLLQELPNGVSKNTVADVLSSLVWRLTRIGVFAIIVAIIPFILLFQQNRLIKAQNIRVDQQTKLSEAERRSSLVFLMSNILDKMDEEIKNAEPSPYHRSRRLSIVTIGRIASLSQSYKPYYYLSGDTLISKPLSPERGQLLLALVNSQLDTTRTYSDIFTKCIFRNADVRDGDLRSTNGLGQFMAEADLQGANFSNSVLWDIKLHGADLSRTNFVRADMSGADLRSGYMIDADFAHADLRNANLQGAELSGVNFANADLRKADFRYAEFTEINLENAKLDGLKVDASDWLDQLDKKDSKTAKKLKSVYAIQKVNDDLFVLKAK